MKEFVDFARKLHTENYARLLKRIHDEQIPIAVVSSITQRNSIEQRDLFIDKLIYDGFNLQYYFTPQDSSKESLHHVERKLAPFGD